MHQIELELDDNLYQFLLELSKEYEISINNLIRLLTRLYIDNSLS